MPKASEKAFGTPSPSNRASSTACSPRGVFRCITPHWYRAWSFKKIILPGCGGGGSNSKLLGTSSIFKK